MNEAPAPAIITTMKGLAAAFTEWDRRYREDPARFMSEAEHLSKETPETYGDACAPYFAKILNDLAMVDAVSPPKASIG
jgi:hypothetical protein